MRMVLALVTLGVLYSFASAQDPIGVSVTQLPSSTSDLTIAPCRFGTSPIRCTNGFPGSCGCGPKPPVCTCPAVYSPVCGVNGLKYGNSCEARCEGVREACKGSCPCKKPPIGCVCGSIFDPVCGANKVTYSSPCDAGCAGTTVACKGGCPCKPTPPPSDCVFSNGRFVGSCQPQGPPRTPDDINNFLDECVDRGASASVAASRAACSLLKNKCPAILPSASLTSSASIAGGARFNPADVLLEKVLKGACLSEAENACKSKAFDNISDSTCSKLLNSGPATPVPGCRTLKDAVNIFNGEVNRLCKN